MMRPWKAAFGVGAACAVCCAVPLVGGAAALTAGTTALVGIGAALLACWDDLMPAAMGLLAMAVVGAGVVWWRRRSAKRSPEAPACGCQPGVCVGAPGMRA